MSQMPKKIDVTVEQLKSIYGQLYDQLQEKAELHLPPENEVEEKGEAKDDIMRKEVQLQLQDFLSQVMDMAANSLRVVNTNEEIKNVKELLIKSQEKYVEPFDLELNEMVRKKYQEWENETVKVSQLRQSAPKELNQIYNQNKHEYLSFLDSRIAELQSESQEGLESNEIPLNEEETFRQGFGDHYTKSLINIAEAQRRLPSTRAHIEKIHDLLQYFERELD